MRQILFAILSLSAISASAGVVAEAISGDGARIVFHDDVGPCVGRAKLAEYVPVNGAVVPGCWLATPSHVAVSFLDGERGSVPVSHLQIPGKPRTESAKPPSAPGGRSPDSI